MATVVPTGEDAVPLHYVVPSQNFNPAEGHYGAFEVTASVGSVRIDAGSTASLLSPTAATRLARTVAGGVSWYPNLGMRFMIDAQGSTFAPFAGFMALPDETVVIGRVQVVL